MLYFINILLYKGYNNVDSILISTIWGWHSKWSLKKIWQSSHQTLHFSNLGEYIWRNFHLFKSSMIGKFFLVLVTQEILILFYIFFENEVKDTLPPFWANISSLKNWPRYVYWLRKQFVGLTTTNKRNLRITVYCPLKM